MLGLTIAFVFVVSHIVAFRLHFSRGYCAGIRSAQIIFTEELDRVLSEVQRVRQ